MPYEKKGRRVTADHARNLNFKGLVNEEDDPGRRINPKIASLYQIGLYFQY